VFCARSWVVKIVPKSVSDTAAPVSGNAGSIKTAGSRARALLQCVVANTLGLHRNGAVGFIDWLGIRLTLLHRMHSVFQMRDSRPNPVDTQYWEKPDAYDCDGVSTP
jgi:hypothetical protein